MVLHVLRYTQNAEFERSVFENARVCINSVQPMSNCPWKGKWINCPFNSNRIWTCICLSWQRGQWKLLSNRLNPCLGLMFQLWIALRARARPRKSHKTTRNNQKHLQKGQTSTFNNDVTSPLEQPIAQGARLEIRSSSLQDGQFESCHRY